MAMPCIAGAARVSKSAHVRAELPASQAPLAQLDQIEAAGMQLVRVHGTDASTQFIGKRMRKAA